MMISPAPLNRRILSLPCWSCLAKFAISVSDSEIAHYWGRKTCSLSGRAAGDLVQLDRGSLDPKEHFRPLGVIILPNLIAVNFKPCQKK